MKNNILEFSKIGFADEFEFLPNYFDLFNTKEKMRQLFLNLINSLIPVNCQFTKEEQIRYSNFSLNKVFKTKISTLKPISNIHVFDKKNSFKFRFCLNSTKIINNFYENKKIKNLVSNHNLVPLATFINFSYVNTRIELMIDKDFLFNEFIIRKLKKIHPDKMIIDEGKCISIVKNKKIISKIYSSWKNINIKNIDVSNEINHIKKVSTTLDFKDLEDVNIYFIYPKNKNFNKHIELKINGLVNFNNKIKLVPYSLRSILRQTI